MATSPLLVPHARAPASARLLDHLLDQALVGVATGDHRTILEVVRDQPGALGAMAARFGMSSQAVSRDLSMFHALEFGEELEALAARYDPALLEAAGLEGASEVLDIGCGSGRSTRAAATAAPTADVLGVDISPSLVRRASERSRAERLTTTRFERGDAEVHPFAAGAFDVALSRLGAMFFHHPAVAFTNIGRALRPGGRLVLLAWRDLADNEWMTAVRDALAQGRPTAGRPGGTPSAFGLADEHHVRGVLGDAGFFDVTLDAESEPVSLGPDLRRAYALVSTQGLARDLLDGVDDAIRSRALDELVAVLAAHETPEGVLFGSSCWIITARHP